MAAPQRGSCLKSPSAYLRKALQGAKLMAGEGGDQRPLTPTEHEIQAMCVQETYRKQNLDKFA